MGIVRHRFVSKFVLALGLFAALGNLAFAQRSLVVVTELPILGPGLTADSVQSDRAQELIQSLGDDIRKVWLDGYHVEHLNMTDPIGDDELRDKLESADVIIQLVSTVDSKGYTVTGRLFDKAKGTWLQPASIAKGPNASVDDLVKDTSSDILSDLIVQVLESGFSQGQLILANCLFMDTSVGPTEKPSLRSKLRVLANGYIDTLQEEPPFSPRFRIVRLAPILPDAYDWWCEGFHPVEPNSPRGDTLMVNGWLSSDLNLLLFMTNLRVKHGKPADPLKIDPNNLKRTVADVVTAVKGLANEF